MASLLFVFQLFFNFAAAETVNSPELYKQFLDEVQGAGAEVEVHGADHHNGLYALSYRPKNFFDYVIVSMVADYSSPEVQKISEQMKKLNRHDFIRIKGHQSFVVLSTQNHVLVNEITVVNKFTGPLDLGGYQHMTKVLQTLKGQDEIIAKVHASLVDGQIFMVEYGDANIPVVVADKSITKTLFRGDKVKMKFAIQKFPVNPTHINCAGDADSLQVIDRVADQHNQPQDRCGELVMFPKSPQVIFNVFALKYDIGDNLFRLYTLINFNDMNLFKALREKAQVAWDANTSTVIQGRNYYINPKLRICAKGTGNMIVPTQANPQILIDKLDDLTIEVLP